MNIFHMHVKILLSLLLLLIYIFIVLVLLHIERETGKSHSGSQGKFKMIKPFKGCQQNYLRYKIKKIKVKLKCMTSRKES